MLGSAPPPAGLHVGKQCYRCGQMGHIRAACQAPDGPAIREWQATARALAEDTMAEFRRMAVEEEEDRVYRLHEDRDRGGERDHEEDGLRGGQASEQQR